MTDLSSLTYFFKQPSLNAWQRRWTTFLGEFGFDIKNFKRKENCVVDTISRKSHHLYEISYIQVEFKFSNLIKEVANKDLK